MNQRYFALGFSLNEENECPVIEDLRFGSLKILDALLNRTYVPRSLFVPERYLNKLKQTNNLVEIKIGKPEGKIHTHAGPNISSYYWDLMLKARKKLESSNKSTLIATRIAIEDLFLIDPHLEGLELMLYKVRGIGANMVLYNALSEELIKNSI